MHPIVEVTSYNELKRVLKFSKAEIIAINNRDLHNFEVDLGKTVELSKFVNNEFDSEKYVDQKKERILCSFSGFSYVYVI